MTRRPVRFLLSCFFAAAFSANILTTADTFADDTELDSIVAQEYEAELCGWGTHDSTPLDVTVKENQSSPTDSEAKTFDSSLASIAAAAYAKTRVSVKQIVEPFAAVGPKISDSIKQVKAFQQWCVSAVERQVSTPAADPVVEPVVIENDVRSLWISHVPIVDFDGPSLVNVWAEQLNLARSRDTLLIDNTQDDNDANPILDLRDDHSLQAEVDDEKIQAEFSEIVVDPLDGIGADAAYGPSILEEIPADEIGVASQQEQNSGDSPSLASNELPASRTVGSSPMIFLMEEAYSPYDLAVRDLYASGVLSIAKRPFCIRARMDLPEHDLAFDQPEETTAVKRDEIESQVVDQVEPEFVMSGSADCLLDDWVWRATLALEEGGAVRKWVRPEVVGRQVAALVAKHNRIAFGLADRLANVWPKSEQPEATAGALLLARAGAVEAGEDRQNAAALDADDTRQLAQAAATLKEWFSAAATMKSRWLPRLAEVVPTTGKTSRR